MRESLPSGLQIVGHINMMSYTNTSKNTCWNVILFSYIYVVFSNFLWSFFFVLYVSLIFLFFCSRSGTTETADILTDFCCKPNEASGSHGGMESSAIAIDNHARPIIHKLCGEYPSYKVIIEGHSLGNHRRTHTYSIID